MQAHITLFVNDIVTVILTSKQNSSASTVEPVVISWWFVTHILWNTEILMKLGKHLMCTTWKKQIQYEIKPLMVWLIIKIIIKDLWLDDKLEKQWVPPIPLTTLHP